MDDDLRANGLIPLTEPYTALGYIQRGGGGGETITSTVLEVTGPDAIVDWVIVEIRDQNDPGRRLLSRCALIQRDGDIVDLDGVGNVGVCVTAGSYFIAVRHRNHLGIMTGIPVQFISGQFGSVFVDPVDLSLPNTPVWRDGQARKRMGTHRAMWNGDVTFDGQVKYTGTGNDRDPLLIEVGGTTPNNTSSGYNQSDVNLDATTKYTGSGNDRDAVLRSVGGTTPNKMREGYLPTDTLELWPDVIWLDSTLYVLDTTLSNMEDLSTMVFDMVPGVEPPAVGSVIMGDGSGSFLQRVTAVSQAGQQVNLITEFADLTDVIKAGTLAFSVPVEQQEQASFAHAPGLSFQFPVQYTCLQGSLSDLQYALPSTVEHAFTFDEEDGIKSMDIRLSGGLVAQGRFNFQVGACATSMDTTVLLTPQRRVDIPIRGPIKLILFLNNKLKVKSEGQIGGTLSLDVPWDHSSHVHSYLSYEDGEYHTTSGGEMTTGAFGEWNPAIQMNAEWKLDMLYEFSVSFFDRKKLLGPYFQLGPSSKFKFGVNTGTYDNNWSYKAGIKAKVGLKAERFAKADLTLIDTNPVEVFSVTSPYLLEIVSGENQFGPPLLPLEENIRVKVTRRAVFLGNEIDNSPRVASMVHFEPAPGSGTVFPADVWTDANGYAETTWILGEAQEDEQRMFVNVRNADGSHIIGSPAEVLAAGPVQMEIVSGDEQIGSVNAPLSNPLVVRISQQLDGEMLPLEGYPVHFEVSAGNGSVSDDLVTTNSDGLAATTFTLGFDAAGQHRVKAYALTNAGDTIVDAPQYFKAYIDPDTMMYALLSGNNQTGNASAVLPVDLRVEVRSVLGQEVQEDVLVYFEVVSGGGSVSSFGTSTNSDGIASVAWTLGPDLTIRQKVKAWALDVYGDTLRGGPLYFEACTIICPPTVTDFDGNVYPVVKIGCDCWTQQNLKTHHFSNGDLIAHIPASTEFVQPPVGSYPPENHPVWNAPYSSEDATQAHVGLVYNGPAALGERSLCPGGWHLQKWTDLDRMASYLTGAPIVPGGFGSMNSGYIKDANTWIGDVDANNISGFTLLPGRCVAGITYTTGNSFQLKWDISDAFPQADLWTGLIIDDPGQYMGVSFGVGSGYLAPVGSTHTIPILKNISPIDQVGPFQVGFGYCRCVLD